MLSQTLFSTLRYTCSARKLNFSIVSTHEYVQQDVLSVSATVVNLVAAVFVLGKGGEELVGKNVGQCIQETVG